ncbi:PqqD family protein [Clostridium sp. KNHs214]|uniref:PqqD family protein n=1 Tax=Clostridium sp. KNHs214 TaxID=1540257 RepID=UPI00068A92DC|nr:PqqD family protein [Clostridium sp. KNHs214]
MKRKVEKKNAVLMTPYKNPEIQWERKENLITLVINRNKAFDKVMQKIFKSPKSVNIELDELGSFVWEKCDGVSNIKDICESLEKRFGKEADPAMERLLTYIKILINNNLIKMT